MVQIELPDEVGVEDMATELAKIMAAYEFNFEDAIVVFFYASMVMLLAEGGELMH